MPYILKKFKDGYKVCKKDDGKCFSKEPLPKNRAKRQMRAIIYHEMLGDGIHRESHHEKALKSGELKSDAFQKWLLSQRIEPDEYLKIAKFLAKETGYDPDKLSFSSDGSHKLFYDSPKGPRHFGKVGYGDYIIYSFLERYGKVPPGTAESKRNTFNKSHGAISERHELDKYTPNELAININW